ncbi:YbdK family carboxylate-amine ligase [Streptomyces abikoensis]|uniref:carboxylate-amine ligase n=1 Tax=Streptomyces abikoensis TaxID=97398 RepID=UPI003404CC93
MLGPLMDGEFTEYQVEVRTPPCLGLDELHGRLVRARAAVVRAAEAEKLRVLPSGTPPPAVPDRAPVTDEPRYRTAAERFRGMTERYLVCASHTHVHLPDPEAAVLVSNHLRPWLPALVAMAANSPFCEGRDTGYASWRAIARLPFPVLGSPPYYRSLKHYRQLTSAMYEGGLLRAGDEVFWDVRISSHVPTLEVRAMDVPATAADTAVLAAIVRALVVVALMSVRAGAPDRRSAASCRARPTGVRRGTDGAVTAWTS